MSTRLPERTPTQLCREAIGLLDAALDKPAALLTAEVDTAERKIVALRDVLIERARRQGSGVDSSLGQVNVAVSLVVGLEYPVAGVQRELLTQARSVLQQVLESGLS